MRIPGAFLFLLTSVTGISATHMFCGPGADPAAYQRFVNLGEPYSLAACAGFDPKWHFDEMKMDLELTTIETIKLRRLGSVAKAALEAGLNEEAKAYADQALALAAEDRFKNAGAMTFESNARGEAVFLGNLVLGRLALLRDDVEAAETHLLLSGQITHGSPIFWGPNMTLARELLKRGRKKVVLEFLEEVKQFWREDCGGPQTVDTWTRIIAAGQMLDDHLTYY